MRANIIYKTIITTELKYNYIVVLFNRRVCLHRYKYISIY